MIVGTKSWALIVFGDIPAGVDERLIQEDLTNISIPLGLMPLCRGSKLLMGSPDDIRRLVQQEPANAG